MTDVQDFYLHEMELEDRIFQSDDSSNRYQGSQNASTFETNNQQQEIKFQTHQEKINIKRQLRKEKIALKNLQAPQLVVQNETNLKNMNTTEKKYFKKEQQKMKNRISAQVSRDRKKNEFESIRYQLQGQQDKIIELEAENEDLKKRVSEPAGVCRYCKHRFEFDTTYNKNLQTQEVDNFLEFDNYQEENKQEFLDFQEEEDFLSNDNKEINKSFNMEFPPLKIDDHENIQNNKNLTETDDTQESTEKDSNKFVRSNSSSSMLGSAHKPLWNLGCFLLCIALTIFALFDTSQKGFQRSPVQLLDRKNLQQEIYDWGKQNNDALEQMEEEDEEDIEKNKNKEVNKQEFNSTQKEFLDELEKFFNKEKVEEDKQQQELKNSIFEQFQIDTQNDDSSDLEEYVKKYEKQCPYKKNDQVLKDFYNFNNLQIQKQHQETDILLNELQQKEVKDQQDLVIMDNLFSEKQKRRIIQELTSSEEPMMNDEDLDELIYGKQITVIMNQGQARNHNILRQQQLDNGDLQKQDSEETQTNIKYPKMSEDLLQQGNLVLDYKTVIGEQQQESEEDYVYAIQCVIKGIQRLTLPQNMLSQQ